mmetsp:Transcript_4570/g.6409  ORF Transcript_4570/g.6409 Transcript_4570/m.6409 type:complete len:311 (-) Transcript_4570:1344-2276(-)
MKLHQECLPDNHSETLQASQSINLLETLHTNLQSNRHVNQLVVQRQYHSPNLHANPFVDRPHSQNRFLQISHRNSLSSVHPPNPLSNLFYSQQSLHPPNLLLNQNFILRINHQCNLSLIQLKFPPSYHQRAQLLSQNPNQQVYHPNILRDSRRINQPHFRLHSLALIHLHHHPVCRHYNRAKTQVNLLHIHPVILANLHADPQSNLVHIRLISQPKILLHNRKVFPARSRHVNHLYHLLNNQSDFQLADLQTNQSYHQVFNPLYHLRCNRSFIHPHLLVSIPHINHPSNLHVNHEVNRLHNQPVPQVYDR